MADRHGAFTTAYLLMTFTKPHEASPYDAAPSYRVFTADRVLNGADSVFHEGKAPAPGAARQRHRGVELAPTSPPPRIAPTPIQETPTYATTPAR